MQELTAHSLVWAMKQVIGHDDDEPLSQDQSDTEFQAEKAQARADAAAAGCPAEELDAIGTFMAIYMSSLRTYTELVAMELVEASNVERTSPSMDDMISGIAGTVRIVGEGLYRPAAVAEDDLADATERAYAMYQEIMVLAHTHRDLDS